MNGTKNVEHNEYKVSEMKKFVLVSPDPIQGREKDNNKAYKRNISKYVVLIN